MTAASGLKGITVIHNTTLGPALGGTRIWNYADENEALIDCLRLARGMTFKSAAAGLNLGGGKTVLIGDANKVKSEAYFRALGRYVQSLNGRYITAEDVNTSTKDMGYVAMETNHVVGLEGKSGNPSPVTAMGVFHGVRAGLFKKFGDTEFEKYTFAVQGAGQTGYYLIKYLVEAGAREICFTELNPRHIERMRDEHPQVRFVKPEEIFSQDVDVLSPCALGGFPQRPEHSPAEGLCDRGLHQQCAAGRGKARQNADGAGHHLLPGLCDQRRRPHQRSSRNPWLQQGAGDG